jgi:tetratricopeptide (TPR) repeat protein
MATGFVLGNADGQQPEGQPDLGLAIEGLLTRLPPELVEAIRLGAVPHRFDPQLLSLLRGSATDTASLLAEMRRLGFLGEAVSGWLTYHDQLRNRLLAGLQSQPALYRQANARAAGYFRTRLALKQNPNPDGDLLEYLYHLLVADETAGLVQLRRHVDGFTRTGQAGLAEQLITYAVEQQAALSQSGQGWLRYLEAQLKQAGLELEASRQVFQELAAQAGDPLLRAAARRSLGETLAQSQQWAAGVYELRAALQAFQDIGDPFETANTQALLGAVFVNLAEAAGGLRDEVPPLESPLERWLYRLQHAPFLAYRWLSRRFACVPNLFFGTDYQNWIIVRYMYNAIRWFTRAERTLGPAAAGEEAARSTTRTHIRIRLADLSHRIGRWSQAERRFAALVEDPTVRTDPYLQGLVKLGRGRALLARGTVRRAMDDLQECQAIFRQYGDLNSSGKAARLIGQAHARLGEIEEAIHAYQAAAEAFYGTHDLLNATETMASAQTLAERLPPGGGDGVRTTEFPAGLARQAYMERFPDWTMGFLHRLFRGLAVFLVLPLTYLLVLLTVFFQTLWTGAVELLFHSVIDSAARLVLLVDLAAALPFLVLMPLLALWAYEAIYTLAGILAVWLLPVRPFTRQQPDYFVLDQQTLGHHDQHGMPLDSIRWSEATIVASLDRSVWRSPLTLFSRFLVGDEDKTLVVDGILNHYTRFKREASKRLRAQPHPARVYSLDYSLLDRRWALATLAATLLIAGIAITLKIVDPQHGFMALRSPSGVRLTLYATDVVFQFWKWLIFVGPLFALVHLLQNRWAIRRSLGNRIRLGAQWPIWLALLIVLILTLGELGQLLS